MNVIRAMQDIEVVGRSRIEELKMVAAKSLQKRSRLLLHDSSESLVQEMIICAHKDSYIRTHRHPKGKAESYHIIEGELSVNIYAEDGELEATFELGRSVGNIAYRVRGGIYHQPRAITEWAIYHEVFTGPFDKERDVQYAPWAMHEKV
jgi:cupin fold WbuC family metalloprotein